MPAPKQGKARRKQAVGKQAAKKRRAPGGSTGRKPSLGPLSPREPRLRPSGRDEVERAALGAMRPSAASKIPRPGLRRSKPMPKVSKVRSKTRTGRAGPG